MRKVYMIEGFTEGYKAIQMRRFASNKRLANSIAANYRRRWPGCGTEVMELPKSLWNRIDPDSIETGDTER